MPAVVVKVEIFYSAAWHEVPVYTRDPITITRGRANESTQPSSATAVLSIDNRSRDYSPRNPESTLYGLIGRNTPIRITANSSVRFVGEVESWPQRSNVKGTDVWSPIVANGILRRLNAPGTTKPAWSAMRRHLTVSQAGLADTGLVDYWACEEAPEADRLTTTYGTAGFTIVHAGIRPSSLTGPLGSTDLPIISNALPQGATFQMSPMTDSGVWIVHTAIQLPPDSEDFLIVVENANHGTHVVQFDLPGLQIVYTVTDQAGATVNTGNVVLTDQSGIAGRWVSVSIGSDLGDTTSAVEIRNRAGEDQSEFVAFIALGGAVHNGGLGSGRINLINNSSTGQEVGFGHVAAYNDASLDYFAQPAALATALHGNVNEQAHERIERLCAEEGLTIATDGATSALMGQQRAAPVVDLLFDCAAADGGVLYETRDTLGLTYRALVDLYNDASDLDVNYAAGGELTPPLDPVEDTQLTGNDITVTRFNGGGYRVTRDTGPLNTQEPAADPQGVGRYRRDIGLYLNLDAQVPTRAGWELNLGTWDEARYPSINISPTAMLVDAKSALAADALAVDLTDRITVSQPPPHLPPEDIVQIVQGYTETIGSHVWDMTFTTSPARPYDVTVIENGGGNVSRLSPTETGTTTNEALDSTETGVDILSTDVAWVDTAGHASDFPFDIMIGGERMTVTAITGTTLSQVMTVTRSVNGVGKSHATGAQVLLFQPTVLAL